MSVAVIPTRAAPLAPPLEPAVRSPRPDGVRCVTCDQLADTPFCPQCGERRAADRVYTLHALAAEAWDQFTPADSRMLRSIWTLVGEPGALTVAYMRGVRQPYLTPLAAFVTVNAAYFLFVEATHVNTFTTPLAIHVSAVRYQAIARTLVARRLAARHTTFAAYAQRFDAVVAAQARSLVGVMVPEFAVLIAVVQLRRHRSALQHLTFALHLTAVFLIILMIGGVVSGLILRLASRGFGARFTPQSVDNATSLGVVMALAVWLAIGFRRAYGDGRLASALKGGLVAVLAFGVVVSAYRALLFFTTYWAT